MNVARRKNARIRMRALIAPAEIPYRYNVRNFLHNLKPTGRLTRQGVRDLNGPRGDGSGYNGNNSASCAHHRSPDTTPTYTVSRMIEHPTEGLVRAFFTHCSSCGAELYENP